MISEIDLGDKVSIRFIERTDYGRFLIIITETENPISWAEAVDLYATRYDLHIYYYHELSKVLFESSTSDAIALSIRKQITKRDAERLSASSLLKAMQKPKSINYMMVRLANVLKRSPSLPAYKILMGKDVHCAVRPNEGRVFTPGHALARISDVETRGIANFQGRVWAIKRATLLEYKDWCNKLGSAIANRNEVFTLPGMEFLTSPKRIHKFPGKPLAILFNFLAIGYSIKIRKLGKEVGRYYPVSFSSEFQFQRMSKNAERIYLAFFTDGADNGIDIVYDIKKNKWKIKNPSVRYDCKTDSGDKIKNLPLEEFLGEFPPYIYMRQGGIVINGCIYVPKTELGKLPTRCYEKKINWSNCDISIEFTDIERGKIPAPGKRSVHDWLETKLKKESDDYSVILKDHARCEIADFVKIDYKGKVITFFHCKAARGEKPSANISDLEVLEQALRSIVWIDNNKLLKEILLRVKSEDRPHSKLIKGSFEQAESIAKKFNSNEWKYVVIIVHPGLDCYQAARKTSTNALLLNCYEWLLNMDASLEIMGNS